MLEIATTTNTGELVVITTYKNCDRLNHSIFKLCAQEMQVDLEYYYRNDAKFFVSGIYQTDSNGFKHKCAIICVIREDLLDGTFYSYWCGNDESYLQCFRRHKENKGR